MQSANAIFSWVHFNPGTSTYKHKKNSKKEKKIKQGGVRQMNTDYMQLLPTVASTGYENSAFSAKKVLLIQLFLNLYFASARFKLDTF